MIEKFTTWVASNWKYLNVAIKFDKEDRVNAIKTGIPVPNPYGNLKNWFQLFGFGTLILFTSVFIIWKLINPPAGVKRSHHGINKYGIRY